MTKSLLTFAFALLLLFTPHFIQAQTAGAGLVSSIESLAQSIKDSENRIKKLEADIDSWKLLKSGLKKLGEERIAKKLDEIENSTSWKNRRKSAQSGWKEHSPGTCGAGGPPPVCPVDHWYRVSVSQAMAEYEAYKQAALDEVLDSIKDQEAGYDNKIDQAYKQIAELRDKILDLRDRMVALSRQYKEKVMGEAKSLHRLWVGDLMQLIAQKHYIEDRLDIISVKQADLDREEAKATAELKDKITRRNEEEKKELNEKLAANKSRADNIEEAYQERVATLNTSLTAWKDRLQTVNRELMASASYTAEAKDKLQSEKTDLESRISTAERQLDEYETAFNNQMQAIQDENRKYSDQIWKLTTSVTEIQNEALQNLKKAFADKRAILRDARAARSLTLEQTGKLLLEKKEMYRRKSNEYADKVNGERIRIMTACSSVSASCYGTDAHGEVVAHWNKVSGCVGEMESAHHSNDVVYGCEEESPVYRQYYLSLINGMSDSDLEALQRKTGRTRYDLIFKKIID